MRGIKSKKLRVHITTKGDWWINCVKSCPVHKVITGKCVKSQLRVVQVKKIRRNQSAHNIYPGAFSTVYTP